MRQIIIHDGESSLRKKLKGDTTHEKGYLHHFC